MGGGKQKGRSKRKEKGGKDEEEGRKNEGH